jgi:hypothetical protein
MTLHSSLFTLHYQLSTVGYNRPMTVRVTMEIADRKIDETVTGVDANDVLTKAKARVEDELGWKGLFLKLISPLGFAQEAIRRYNEHEHTSYDVPQSAEEFLKLGTDLGYLTILSDDNQP